MPLTRYRVRSEYGLADPELYRAADKDDPEALLEGVAMAGLVGVLRQLGDLAEFAAEIFHDLHEEVMATAARGHALGARVQQLEAEFPPIEKALLSQTNHKSFFTNAGVDWHPNLRSEQTLIARGDLPRFVMDSYEECRGPPRLFLLDKFDVAGAGACLKRYTDPSFFKVEAASGIGKVEIQREKKSRKVKKRGSRWRNGETTPEVVPTSHTKLHQLFLEERVENGISDPARLVKLKRRQLNGSAVDSKTGKSYMEKFLEVSSPERELCCDTSVTPPLLTYENTSESGLRILEISTVSPAEQSPRSDSACSSPNAHEVALKPPMNGYNKVLDREILKGPETHDDENVKVPTTLPEPVSQKRLVINGERKAKGSVDGYGSDDMTSEVDNYVDALATMESEMETDNEWRPRSNLRFLNAENHGTDSDEHLELHAQLSDSPSVGNFSTSDDGNNSFKKNRSSFSYSDTPSSLAENIPSECYDAAKVYPSTEAYRSETVDMPSNELSVIPQSLGATSGEFEVSQDMGFEEDNIPDHGGASSNELHTDLYPTSLLSDPGASSSTVSLVGPELGETSTEGIQPNTAENATTLVVSSQINDDFTETSERCLVNKLDDEDPNRVSEAVYISELASEKERRDSSVNEVSQVPDQVEDSNQNLDSDKIDSPSISSTERQLRSSALPDFETCSGDLPLPDSLPASSVYHHSNVVEPNDLVPKVDDSATATGVDSEDSSPIMDTAQCCGSEEVPSVVDSQQTPGVKEEQFMELSEDDPHFKPVSEEAGDLSSKDSNVEEISRTMDSAEIGLSESHVDVDTAVSVEHQSSGPSSPGDNDHINPDDVVAETVEVEDLPVPSACVSNVDNLGNVCFSPDHVHSPSRDLTNLPEFLLSSVDHSHHNVVECDMGVSPECVPRSETQEEPDHLELASTDSAVNTISVSYEHSSPKIVDVDDLSPSKNKQDGSVSDFFVAPTSLELRDQESELGSFPDIHLELSELQNAQVDVKHLGVDQASVNSLDLPSEQIESLDCVDKDSNEQAESPEHLNQEVCQNSSLESCQEELPSHSTSEFSFLSAGHEVDNVKQTFNPSESTVPSFVSLSEPAQVDLGEMPPLPPLPPMQWRMGKFNQGFFPQIQPRADEKAQFQFPAPQSGLQQPQNPFLPTIAENGNSQPVSGPSLGNLAHTTTYAMQLPTLVSDAKSYYNYNYAALEGTQAPNPFLTRPGTLNEGPSFLTLEEEMVQTGTGTNPFSSTPTTSTTSYNHDISEAVVQPLNQLAQEAGHDNKVHQQSVPYSEREQENLLVTSMLPPTPADEQAHLGLLMPEGETAWSSSNSSTMMSDSETGKSDGNPVNKVPRPRNPLIDAVNAHGQSKLRKVAERVRPRIGPKADERDSLLEQIRTKSFNLKPATATRPSIQGPKTNLKVAAILEKANAIRQALAGSDEDDDENWSDS
ncbi:hypothetical protein UlMin_000870 [Ulmus minor]